MRQTQFGIFRTVIWSFGLTAILVVPTTISSQSLIAPVIETVEQMQLITSGAVEVQRSSLSGLTAFVGSRQGATTIPTGLKASATPADKARAFLTDYGEAFGIHNPSQVRVLRAVERDETGMEHVRLQQMHRGVPVTGGELTVHMRDADVVSVLAETLPDLDLIDPVPSVDAKTALAAAQVLLEKHFSITDATLSTPRLEIFNRGVLEDIEYPTHLAWFVEATKTDLREFIWIDAHTGSVLLNFSQLTDALNRMVYDANSSTSTRTRCRFEGDPPSGDPDCDFAYDHSGDTYNYFLNEHGRDSYDDNGAPLVSFVDACVVGEACPYKNAMWNGSEVVYGAGFPAADDVVAHELTHAVTQFSASLFYYMQSGAMNESYSDIFGETVDMTNGSGNDTSSVDWKIGEDEPNLGVIRNMIDPTALGDPGKVSDTQFFVCQGGRRDFFGLIIPDNDNGGVHTNSGVPNHAYALMVDGGSYNGFTISGIDLTKAAKIQYRALTQYLTSGSNFVDNHYALQQSCEDLIGTVGITAGDCAEVDKALDAVEMAMTPCNQPQEASVCPAGETLNNVFFDDLESGGGNWFIDPAVGVNAWVVSNTHAASGTTHLLGKDNPASTDSRVFMNQDVTIPPNAYLHFNHAFEFENGAWDGGVIEYSMNSGSTWMDAGSLITSGATYNGTIGSTSNPLNGRAAFVNESFGYTATKLDLSSLSGQNVRFRFRIGTDSILGDRGWDVDDVRIYQCSPPTTLTVAPTPVQQGANVNMNWANVPNPSGTDWIGVYAPGAANTAYLDWMYTSCTKTPGVAQVTGSCAYTVTEPPGTYESRLFANNTYTLVVTSNPWTVTSGGGGGGGTTLTVAPTPVQQGANVNMNWANVPGPTGTDWIGVYAPGTANTAYLDWMYTSCTKTPGVAQVTGSCAYTVTEPPGTYESRLFANNTYTLVVTSNPWTVQ